MDDDIFVSLYLRNSEDFFPRCRHRNGEWVYPKNFFPTLLVGLLYSFSVYWLESDCYILRYKIGQRTDVATHCFSKIGRIKPNVSLLRNLCFCRFKLSPLIQLSRASWKVRTLRWELSKFNNVWKPSFLTRNVTVGQTKSIRAYLQKHTVDRDIPI